jgi:hypothetical protein
MTEKSELENHLCYFNPAPNHECSNLQGYEKLIDEETCDHIKKALPKATDYELYAVMDANCHRPPPSDPCIKPESSDLRLIIKWTKSRNNTKPRRVSCFLTSYRPDLLRFTDGEVDADSSTIDLKSRAFVLTPILKKRPSCRSEIVRVEKTPGVAFNRAPVKVQAFLWKDFPNDSGPPQNAYLEVAIPPAKPGLKVVAPPAKPKEDEPLFLKVMSNDQPLHSTLVYTDSQIIDVLSKIDAPVFETLLVLLHVPQDIIPPQDAPRRMRAIAVVKWVATQGDEVRRLLLEELRRVAPGIVKDGR